MSMTPPSACESIEAEWEADFDGDENQMLFALGGLTGNSILEKVSEYSNLAYELGLEEAKEMTRGALLKVFNTHQTAYGK